MKDVLLAIATSAVIFIVPILGVMSYNLPGTPYEGQIKGFMSATVSTFVHGEFAGRSILSKRFDPARAACTPDDFEKLLVNRGDDAVFERFDSSCRIITFTEDWRHVHGVVRLPQGYCETIKTAYDHMLATQIKSYFTKEYDEVIISYRGAYTRTSQNLARSAKLQTNCRADGSFYIRAERKRLWGVI
jgi:hypothetical protein